MEGEQLSPWVFLLLLPLAWGEIGPSDCVRFPLIFLLILKYSAAPRTPSLLRTVFLATTPQSGMWMQMEIPAYRSTSICSSKTFMIWMPSTGLCHKIQCCQGRDCPVQDQDRFFKLPTGYLPRRMVRSLQGHLFKIILGTVVPEQDKWQGWILFHHFDFPRYWEIMDSTLKQSQHTVKNVLNNLKCIDAFIGSARVH